jgi:hypothetical protein
VMPTGSPSSASPILRLPWSGMAMMWPGILGEVTLAREEEDWALH